VIYWVVKKQLRRFHKKSGLLTPGAFFVYGFNVALTRKFKGLSNMTVRCLPWKFCFFLDLKAIVTYINKLDKKIGILKTK